MSQLSLERPIALPFSVLVDAEGLVVAIYKGPVDVDRVLSDAQVLGASPLDQRTHATPFRGRWYSKPMGADPVRVALKMVDACEIELGERYLEKYLSKYKQGKLPESRLKDSLSHRSLSDVHYALARLRRQTNDLDGAVAAYREIIRNDPNNSKTYVELGQVLLQAEQPTEALDAFESALRGGLASADQLTMMAMCHRKLGNLEEAVRTCGEALDLDAENADARFTLATIHHQQGDLESAISGYREAIRLRPGWQQPSQLLAWILATANSDNLRDGPEAIRLAKEVCKNGNTQPESLRVLAAAYAENGNFKEAIATLDRAIAIAKTNESSRMTAQLKNQRQLALSGKPFRQ